MTQTSLADVLTALEREGLLEAGRASAYLAGPAAESESPWYLRAMVGGGAWLAALLLIGFVVAFALSDAERSFVVLGLLFVVGALAMRRRIDNDFVRQLTLAVSLAGQWLLAAGVLATVGGDARFEIALATLIVVNGALIVLFPDDTHRLLSTLAIVASVAGLLYASGSQALIPFLGPAAIAAAIGLARIEKRFAPLGSRAAASAVRAGLVLGACGCLLLSAVYVLPELGDREPLYPRPWISTLLLGAILLKLVGHPVDALLAGRGPALRVGAYLAAAAIVAAAWVAPGIVLAVVIVVFGGIVASRFYVAAGIAFLAVFMSAYFYGIEIGMLAKSATLAALGLVALVARVLFLRHVPPRRPDASEVAHVAAASHVARATHDS